MRHVGEKFQLVTIGGLDLAALILDFPEQPRVLNREGPFTLSSISASTRSRYSSP
jgi:hypothetical protein